MQQDIKKYLQAVEQDLKQCCDTFFLPNSQVAQAARYSLLDAGKRVRAVLIFLTADMCGINWQQTIRFASAVEMVHCYSLIHDDLPCMDNDDLRRGKPSCHKVFGEDIALLAGDALLGCGMEAIANMDNLPSDKKVQALMQFTKAIGPKGMIYGQELDLEFETKAADKDTLNKIHRNKTGRLISLCGYLGSLLQDIGEDKAQAISLFFENIGLVFQIIDDILDVQGNEEELGKPVGSDSENNKSTFVSLYGLEQSQIIAENLTKVANESLSCAFGEKAEQLIWYTQYLLNRKN